MSLLRTCNAVIVPEASESGRRLYPSWRWEVRPISVFLDASGESRDSRSTRDLSHIQPRKRHCPMKNTSRHDRVLLSDRTVSVPQPRAVSSSGEQR